MIKEYELVWHGSPGSPELEAEVVADMRREMPKLKRAEDLLMHVYCLDDSHTSDGPSVKVWGEKGDHRFHCEYKDHFAGMKFHIDDIPGFREKLEAAGWKDPDKDDG